MFSLQRVILKVAGEIDLVNPIFPTPQYGFLTCCTAVLSTDLGELFIYRLFFSILYIKFDVLMRPKFSLEMAYASFLDSLIIFLIISSCALAQKYGSVSVGSTLTANGPSRPWLSPTGDFAFGFKQLQDKELFLLSIWYAKIPDQTIVWFTNSIDPVPRGSTVELNQTGLVLRDPQGRLLWSTQASADDADHGLMNDTGNFIIMRRDNIRLWQSFDFPADTILPLQELLPGSVLISRQSETNFSRGRFYLSFRDNGNLVLTTRSVPTNQEDDAEYYNSQTSDDANNGSASGVRVIFDERGSMNILRRNNQSSDLTPRSIPSASDNYFRATLNFDGVFTHYYHPRTVSGTANWTAVWWQPDNICINIGGDKGSGACGYNNVCRVGSFGRPICECPNGYELLDPNDTYGSCKPNFTESCGDVVRGSIENLYDFVVLDDTDWPKSDFQQMKPSTETKCRQACLQDCFCAVAIFRDNSCWKKKLPLSNGRIDTTLNSKAFLKFRKREVPELNPGVPVPEGQKPKTKDDGTLITVGSVLLGTSGFINVVLICAICCGFYPIYGKKKAKLPTGNDSPETNLGLFTYKELAEATNGFKEEIGRGSYGIVYKGVIEKSGRSIVAVKKLDQVARDTEKEFRAEVNSIGQTHHKNLVRLLGFCDEGQHRLLVYEYLSNGTLSDFLFSEPRSSWSIRTQIAIGIARGLTYLHEECSKQIIHCDIKPQNILLDDYYNARISDFGLAKLLALNQSRTLTDIRGTKGYVAPEWFRSPQVTAKVDVYSFGVLLLEIISCRRCLEDVETGEGENPILVDWVWDCFQDRRLDTLVQNDLEALNDKEKLERFVKVGIWCIQEDSSLRPTMRKVGQMLEGLVEVMPPTCPYPLYVAE